MFDYWVTAVAAKPEEVFRALGSWPSPNEARIEFLEAPCGPTHGTLQAVAREGFLLVEYRAIEGWTLLFVPLQRLIPSLVHHVSRALGAKVVSVDRNEADGYAHFSILESGRTDQLFTLFPDGETESHGVDVFALHRAAVRDKVIKVPKFRDEAAEAEYVRSAAIFRLSQSAPLDLVSMVEDDDALAELPCARLFAGDAAARALSKVVHVDRFVGFEELARGA